MKLTLIGTDEENQHLFTQMSIDDKVHNFLVDTGSDLSYMYFFPLGAIRTGDYREYFTHESATAVTTAEKFEYNKDYYYFSVKPKVIELLEQNHKVKISGVIGLHWLISNKIVLNFGKLK